VHAAIPQEILGIANRLSLDHEVTIVGAARRNAYGFCERMAAPALRGDIELWECAPTEFSRTLRGDGQASAKRWGIRTGELLGWPVGCLVWYRGGDPLLPALMVLAEDRALSGDWGPTAMPAAYVTACTTDKLYSQTHMRVAEVVRLSRFSGPLTIWGRFGPRGSPVFESFDLSLGGLAVEASLDLADTPLAEFLQAVFSSETPAVLPSWPAHSGACAVRVSWPPWPHVVYVVPEGEVEGLEAGDWVHAVERDEDDSIRTAGPPFVAADVVAVDRVPANAVGNAITRARRVRVPQAQVRSDSLVDLTVKLKKLAIRGYE
jgi:hypothetical protein